jgi:hypothetical protein
MKVRLRTKPLLNREFFQWHVHCSTLHIKLMSGGTKMNATVNEVRLAGLTNNNEASETTATRVAQNSLLSELPGIVFGLITLGYVISSLVALA